MAGQTRKKGTLTKEEIVSAALSIIEEAGPAACSMRAVASKVGVTPMALYGYITNRNQLLNDACEMFLKGVEVRSIPGEMWNDTLLRTMTALRRACLRNPHMGELLNDSEVSAGLEPYMMRVRSLFLAQGMPEEIAVQLLAIADSFFAGFILRSGQRLTDERAPQAAEASPSFAATSRVPGMLTGRAKPSVRLNDRWRQTVAAGYSLQSFENGLFVIIEGVRAGMGSHPCDWKTPPRSAR